MLRIRFFIGSLLISGTCFATSGGQWERISILGGREKALSQAGSAFSLDEEDLDRFQLDDIHRVLKDIPGVNLQEEDGFGLRPNIGLRGAHPHRSRKVTLLEDGVLIGPAPYAAPAAYYFPMVYRATGVEVFKGPSAIRFGPNSVGGAVNFLTRPPTEDISYAAAGEFGSFQTRKLQAYLSRGSGPFRFLLEGARLESDGFKHLPDGGATGFTKDDLMFKSDYELSQQQSLAVKLVRAHEASQETYLGLTPSDFEQDPFQRYAASQRDQMHWRRDQLMLSHEFFGADWQLSTRIYRHWFQRNWSKFSGFADGEVDPREVLLEPYGANEIYSAILKGEEDSDFASQIIIGDNRRTYRVEGIQSELSYARDAWLQSTLEFQLGLRLHQDQIERDHSEQSFAMQAGRLQPAANGERRESNQLQDQSRAVSTYLEATQVWQQLRWSLGGRVESVRNRRLDRLEPEVAAIQTQDNVPSFGSSLHYQLTPALALFGGVYQGRTLVGPGQSEAIEPERSLNQELGLRYLAGMRRFDLIAFHSDYENIKGTCSFSAGCSDAELDREFNGGQALIQGLEWHLQDRYSLSSWHLFTSLSYTLTEAYFTKAVSSQNPEWGIGEIAALDPLPYIARHNLSATLGLATPYWDVALSYQYKSRMFDQSVAASRRAIPAYEVYDLSAFWALAQGQQLYLKLENVADRGYLVSYRPYGLRPGKPQMLSIGYRYKSL